MPYLLTHISRSSHAIEAAQISSSTPQLDSIFGFRQRLRHWITSPGPGSIRKGWASIL